ncbi:hypothetical protein HOV23_gp123 [Pseudomonas phage Lana]|uniref:Uncharacterized protein n=1 Tax=Pseudomonas phage Lana TaxID=2530172 RepID=A0A481W6S4_9CAUD|nr:hypothetical protein HOV23_gp123 [Pseudomonas phage Lana]QBJ04450.1 hypothetical protein [Pseudomonas phage Lana]
MPGLFYTRARVIAIAIEYPWESLDDGSKEAEKDFEIFP